MKLTPRTDELGDFTLEYQPKLHPVPKKCHVHLRWAKETCPKCNSALMIYYAPTFKHRIGKFALTKEEAHPLVFVSCVKCGNYAISQGPSIIVDNSDEPKGAVK